MLAIATICVLAVLVTVPALAVTNHWWFLDAGGPTPVTSIVEVKAGASSVGPWTLTAYVSESDGVCVALTTERLSGATAQGCGAPVRGAPDASEGRARLHWLGYVYSSGDQNEPVFVFGPSAASVERVDIVLADGTTESTDTIAAPAELGLSVRFFVAELPADTNASALIARAASGAALERLRVPPPGLP